MSKQRASGVPDCVHGNAVDLCPEPVRDGSSGPCITKELDAQYRARLKRLGPDDETPEVFEYKPMRPLTAAEEEAENW